ncbi:MAG: DUF3310 domain-containing protein [Hydrogenophaga sp.]|nr:DUF3310 domain-containing protein [Hydrogenophaga sp.]
MKPRDEVLLTLTKNKHEAVTGSALFKVCKGFECAKDLSTMLSNLHKEGLISRTFAPPGGQSKFMYWNEPHGFNLADASDATDYVRPEAVQAITENLAQFFDDKGPLPAFNEIAKPINVTPVKIALNTQEGGSHYKDMKIQPVEYIIANGLGFCEGSVVKYVSRWKNKNGVEDLKKARHFLDILIEQHG